jgi:hypothetical protein
VSKQNQHDPFASLKLSYNDLVKSGVGSLQAALTFGGVVDALSISYTLKSMAESLGVSQATVARYRKLYGKYQGDLTALLAKAAEIESYDIGKLSADEVTPGPQYTAHCTNCGASGKTIVKRRVTKEDAVAGVIPPIKFKG